jgi:hypothetical protein
MVTSMVEKKKKKKKKKKVNTIDTSKSLVRK